jgi:nucleoside-diphosphate-sugar epimerase
MVRIFIGGAAGFIATDIIHKILSNPEITIIYAFSRRLLCLGVRC